MKKMDDDEDEDEDEEWHLLSVYLWWDNTWIHLPGLQLCFNV